MRCRLTDAASRGDTEALKALLALGADVNERGPDGWTALMFAVVQGNTDMALALLKAGANVNFPASDGWTPLMKACLWSRGDLVLLLLKYGADAEAKATEGETAWTIALHKGNQEVIQKLQGMGKRAAR